MNELSIGRRRMLQALGAAGTVAAFGTAAHAQGKTISATTYPRGRVRTAPIWCRPTRRRPAAA